MAFNTGNPVEPNGSTDPRDLKDNAAIIDKLVNSSDVTWTGRLGKPLKTWSGFEQDYNALMASMGFEPIHLVYTPGTPLSVARPTQLVDYNGSIYRAKVPTSFPLALTGVWATDAPKLVDVGDASLRSSLAAPGSTVSIGGVPASDVSKLAQAVKVETDGRVRSTSNIVVGSNAVTGPAVRDAYTVARNVVGLTDCHDFASKTVISGVTDYGGFGTFDATTTLIGSNNQDHMFDIQARNKYSGSGSINYFAGMILRPEHNGTGVINNRFGIDLTGTVITAGGTILEETGIRIRELVGANANVGLRTDQRIVAGKVSYNIYSPATAPSYHNGSVAIGVDTNATAKFTVTHGLGTQTGFMDSTSDTVQIGSVGDSYFGVYTNAGLRLELRNSAEGYTFRPGTTNTQYNGDASKYWKGGYIGTAWQVVSDGTKKTPVRSLVDAEIKTAQELADEIGIWQFLDSVAEKGDDVARLHVSMTVQKAIEVFERNGLDARRYGFICLDTWPDEYVDHPAEVVEHPEVIKVSSITDGNGQPYKTVESEAWTETLKPAWTEKVREAGQLYSFRESGILWFIMAGLNASIKSCCPSDSQHPTS